MYLFLDTLPCIVFVVLIHMVLFSIVACIQSTYYQSTSVQEVQDMLKWNPF